MFASSSGNGRHNKLPHAREQRRYKAPRVVAFLEVLESKAVLSAGETEVAAFTKAHCISAAEEAGSRASVIAHCVSVARQSEAAPSNVGVILSDDSEARCQSLSAAGTLSHMRADLQHRGRPQANGVL